MLSQDQQWRKRNRRPNITHFLLQKILDRLTNIPTFSMRPAFSIIDGREQSEIEVAKTSRRILDSRDVYAVAIILLSDLVGQVQECFEHAIHQTSMAV